MASWGAERASDAVEGHERVYPDPKPEARHKASQTEWDRIREQFRHACCVSCGEGRDTSLHHAVPKSQGGGDLTVNLVPLCGDGTRGCHGRLEAHSPGWERIAAAVREYICQSPQRWAYVVGTLGEARFDRRYPSLNRICPDGVCVLVAGHPGPHAGLSDDRFQPRPDPWEPPRIGEREN